MLTEDIEVIILAAGLGTRMNSQRPKVLHELAGKPMISYLIDTVKKIKPKNITFVIGPEDKVTGNLVKPYDSVVQKTREGTAHAVISAKDKIKLKHGTVLILFGADPCSVLAWWIVIDPAFPVKVTALL